MTRERVRGRRKKEFVTSAELNEGPLVKVAEDKELEVRVLGIFGAPIVEVRLLEEKESLYQQSCQKCHTPKHPRKLDQEVSKGSGIIVRFQQSLSCDCSGQSKVRENVLGVIKNNLAKEDGSCLQVQKNLRKS